MRVGERGSGDEATDADACAVVGFARIDIDTHPSRSSSEQRPTRCQLFAKASCSPKGGLSGAPPTQRRTTGQGRAAPATTGCKGHQDGVT